MNKIYAIIIMLYCWCQSLSQEYIGLQQYQSPESLDRQAFSQNLSTPRLSYQQILRKLLLPYHHQLPYCSQIPSVYHYNASVHQDLPPSHQYLLFYQNLFYHQNLLNQSQQYLQGYQQKPPSEYLLFFYHNTFYHENSHISQANMYSLYDTIDNFRNGLQEDNMSRWKTTPIIYHHGWITGKMPAPTCKHVAGYQKRNLSQIATKPMFTSNNKFETCIKPNTECGKSLAYNSLNRFVKIVSGREKTLTFNILNRLVTIVRNGTRWRVLQNKTYVAYNYEWLSIIKRLKHTLKKLKNLSSYDILNRLMNRKASLGQPIFMKNVGCSNKLLKNLTGVERQGLYKKYMKSQLRTLYCQYNSKSGNSTRDGVSSFTPYGRKTISNINRDNQAKVYSHKKYADHMLNLQNEHSHSRNHFNTQMQIRYK